MSGNSFGTGTIASTHTVEISNGVDVASERNASLTFEGNTLYYVQDDQTIPGNLVNVRFLVVGGGGGGGGDSSVNDGGQGGAGGGGGGVITGFINSVSANVNLAVVVGAGGAGGPLSTTGSSDYTGTAAKGGASSVSLGSTILVSAEGGGHATDTYGMTGDSPLVHPSQCRITPVVFVLGFFFKNVI